MNKTLLMCATFATAGLMAASCSSELDQPTAEGGDGYVTITARMPENFKTRGFSDGEKAQTLHYAVYDAGTNTVIFSSKNQGDPVASYNGDKTLPGKCVFKCVANKKFEIVSFEWPLEE